MSGLGVGAASILPVSAAYLARFSWEERKARSNASTSGLGPEDQPQAANRAALTAPYGVATGPNVPWVDIWPEAAAARIAA
jgi:hypothetical protein